MVKNFIPPLNILLSIKILKLRGIAYVKANIIIGTKFLETSFDSIKKIGEWLVWRFDIFINAHCKNYASSFRRIFNETLMHLVNLNSIWVVKRTIISVLAPLYDFSIEPVNYIFKLRTNIWVLSWNVSTLIFISVSFLRRNSQS